MTSVIGVVILALDFPVMLRGAPPQMLGFLKKAFLKTGVFAAVVLVFYSWLGFYLWRATKRSA